jgi:hypothetical protein
VNSQEVLVEIVRYYNEVRPYRGIERRMPYLAYNARTQAKPHTLIHQPHWRIQKDTVDVSGHSTLRYMNRYFNVGWAYRGQEIRLCVLDDVVTFATVDGEFIGETKNNPDRDYQPPKDRASDNPEDPIITVGATGLEPVTSAV